jgi:hypothetical protein
MNVVSFPREARSRPRTAHELAGDMLEHLTGEEAYLLADFLLAVVLVRAQRRETAPLASLLEEVTDRVLARPRAGTA